MNLFFSLFGPTTFGCFARDVWLVQLVFHVWPPTIIWVLTKFKTIIGLYQKKNTVVDAEQEQQQQRCRWRDEQQQQQPQQP